MTRPQPKTVARLALTFLAASALAACKVGPNYSRPPLTLPTAWKSPAPTAVKTSAGHAAHLGTDWWTLFNDPQLTRLETRAIQHNTDLQAAVARLAQARASAMLVKTQFYPVVTLDPSFERARYLNLGYSENTAHTRNTIQIPFDLSYEIDIWGRVRRSYDSANATAQASADDLEVVLQTLQADVAVDYFTLRSLDSQARVYERTVQSYRRQVALLKTQLKAGLISPVDLLQAQALLQSTVTQQLDIERQRGLEEHALAILLGEPPANLGVPARPLDLTPPIIPPSLPADLLRRRPDVAEAEQNLIAASEQIGIATAQLYPTVKLTGAAGFESFNIQTALDWQNRVWSIGPSVTFPIFEAGALQANLEQVRGRYHELEATYRGRVLAAFRDVEDALLNIHMQAREGDNQAAAVDSARKSLEFSQLQYKQGLVSYLQVIDAERTLLANELTAVQILQQRLSATVLLIKAIGGGWEAPTEKSNDTPPPSPLQGRPPERGPKF